MTSTWAELERKLVDTSSKLGGHAFPIDHLFNLVAQSCRGPFTEAEAMEIAPLLARVLSIEQLEYLLAEAKQVIHEATESVTVAALQYVSEQSDGMDAGVKVSTPAAAIAAPESWAHRYSLASQGAMLLALMWAVLPPGEMPAPMA